MGAAGRDFHTFNICFRDNPEYAVVAFTAAQIQGIESHNTGCVTTWKKSAAPLSAT
jgi:predicted GTPase